MGIQETQLIDVNSINVDVCWDNGEFGHVATPASDRSGGLLSIWDSRIYQVEGVITFMNFLITIGRWIGIQEPMIFANVYGPHNSHDKKKLWEDLCQIKNENIGNWALFGEFHIVRRRDERYNSEFLLLMYFGLTNSSNNVDYVIYAWGLQIHILLSN